MHVSRNKCELIAECCVSGVKPKYDIYGIPTIKNIDILSIVDAYNFLSKNWFGNCNKNIAVDKKRLKMRLEYYEYLTELFYIMLNERDMCATMTSGDIERLAVKELDEIIKNRELEEAM